MVNLIYACSELDLFSDSLSDQINNQSEPGSIQTVHNPDQNSGVFLKKGKVYHICSKSLTKTTGFSGKCIIL